jgi:hypothetical protein
MSSRSERFIRALSRLPGLALTAVGLMLTAVGPALTAVGLALTLWAAPAYAQGDCRIPGAGEDGLWVSVAPMAGVAVSIPTANPMNIRRATAAYGGEITLNLPRRFAIGVLSSYSYFSGQMSYTLWVRHLDFLALGHFPLVVSERLDWTLLVGAGLSRVSKQFVHNPVAQSVNGQVSFTGEIRRLSMTTFTGGLGTRLTFYPADFLGIFAQALVTYAYYKELELNEGPCNALITGGLEAHF